MVVGPQARVRIRVGAEAEPRPTPRAQPTDDIRRRVAEDRESETRESFRIYIASHPAPTRSQVPIHSQRPTRLVYLEFFFVLPARDVR